jgi:hypothetical protein
MGSTVAPQFTIEPPDQNKFEIEPPAQDTSGTGFWSHVGQSLKSMAPKDIPSITDALKQAGIEGLGPGYQAVQALHSAATEYAAARERGHGVPYSAAAGASTAVGVSPERMEDAASKGDTAGVLGEAVVPTAMALAPVAGEAFGKVTPSAGSIGTALRTESGALKPGVQVVSKGAGAAAGGALGGGWGALVGEHLGTNLADWLIPDRPKGAPPIKNTPFESAPNPVADLPKPSGPTPPPRKLTLGQGEDLGLGLGNEHIITNAQGERIGSAQIESKDDGTVHVHWLGGDFANYGRSDVMGAIKEAYPDANKITYDRRRLAKGANAATTQPREMNVAQAPTVNDVASQVVANSTGVKPLAPNVPLKEQGTPVAATGETDPLKVKYPDPAQRQMVRANGEKIFQAVGGDSDVMKQVHDLTRVDLRQALVNSGEDMGQRTVSNSKFAGEGSITREDAFNKLLAKGHSPADIVRMAKQVPQ